MGLRVWMLLVLLLPFDVRAAAEAAAPAEALETALAAPALRGATVAALVVNAANGSILFERIPDRALVPASNLKILTALASLATFGPSHRFETRVWMDAPLDASGAADLLYLQGGGDPTLTSESWWRLAADLRLAGLRRVRGGLVIDDSAFDAQRWHPSWGAVSSRAYYAPVGALSANYGAFSVEVGPGVNPGEPLAVVLDPPVAYLRVVNRGRTAPAGVEDSLVVERVRVEGVEEVRLSGAMPADGSSRRLYRSVADPARYAAAVMRMQLEANGIPVGSTVRVGSVPEAAQELLVFEGRPLGEILQLLVKYSNNGIAESLVKSMGLARDGAPGSWANGVPATRERLRELGLDTTRIHLVDGSGLSARNRVTPRLLVDALRMARDSFALGPELVSSLPIAARDGTLAERAGGAEGLVRAKTGLLDKVTGLSGYAQRADGGQVIFSILVNGYRGSDEAAMEAVDGFVAALVNAEVGQAGGGQSAPSRASWSP